MDTKSNNKKYFENRGIQALLRREEEYSLKLKELSKNLNNFTLEKEVNYLFQVLNRSWDIVRRSQS